VRPFRINNKQFVLFTFQPVDGCRKGRSGDAEANVHSPGQSGFRRAMDAEGRLLPQAQALQQHLRQARICKSILYFQGRVVKHNSNHSVLMLLPARLIFLYI
jgi:hypothetical protein